MITVISGGGSGLGFEISSRLLERTDSACAVLDLDPGQAGKLVEIHGERVKLLQCDVTAPSQVVGAFEELDDWGAPVVGAVNCAGIAEHADTLTLSHERWRKVLDVHIDGTFLVSQQAARRMMGAGGGSIVNLGSVAGLVAYPRRLAYSAAKAAIGAMTRTMAVEWAPSGIRVNCVAPGYIETPLVSKLIAAGQVDVDAYAPLHALSRFGKPVEVANVVLFLLSGDASFVTGDTIMVDGGFSVKKLPDE
jgi:NAD(P)-dependent dehydrogenase (short-subunit alcohol dehydrogenase family)